MPIQRQYIPVTDSRRYTTHLDSVHEGARLDKKSTQNSRCRFLWYPRVQFKVRVFHALVVTGTVPVVLRIFVERRHRLGATSGLSRDRGETRLDQSLCRATYSITCARFQSLSPFYYLCHNQAVLN